MNGGPIVTPPTLSNERKKEGDKKQSGHFAILFPLLIWFGW